MVSASTVGKAQKGALTPFEVPPVKCFQQYASDIIKYMYMYVKILSFIICYSTFKKYNLYHLFVVVLF